MNKKEDTISQSTIVVPFREAKKLVKVEFFQNSSGFHPPAHKKTVNFLRNRYLAGGFPPPHIYCSSQFSIYYGLEYLEAIRTAVKKNKDFLETPVVITISGDSPNKDFVTMNRNHPDRTGYAVASDILSPGRMFSLDKAIKLNEEEDSPLFSLISFSDEKEDNISYPYSNFREILRFVDLGFIRHALTLFDRDYPRKKDAIEMVWAASILSNADKEIPEDILSFILRGKKTDMSLLTKECCTEKTAKLLRANLPKGRNVKI